MSKPIALILGAGANIGTAVARRFNSEGYSVAVASRSYSDTPTPDGYFGVKTDFSDSTSIPEVFRKVKAALGNPSVVVYNAASAVQIPDADNILSLPVEEMKKSIEVNTWSPYVAAQETIKGFEELPKEGRKVFIYTGNILNTTIIPVGYFLALGIGKSASAHWIGAADAAFSEKGYRFYYTDERTAEGKSVGQAVSGDAAADFYLDLATGKSKAPWAAIHVKGQGYTDFSKPKA
ncbi:putative short-chain dehydrogenase [Patellaria atrata CBS 101060]|uniref:Short-chain dehydrogenase n=1 Tax=Patellaria atrata CBS 101060 TaxID=1346257 RepID=A0A9P4SA97_9PEZI|nr:putative short-chain dehydrogenase [Patellaria atrata CBS 101060]